MTSDPTSDALQLRTLRTLLLGLVVFASFGLLAEMILLEHWGTWTQQLPVVLLAALGFGAFALLVRPGPKTVRFLRIVATLAVGAGLVGAVLHWRANAGLELEIDPTLGFGRLFRAALGGGVPTLAPGAMIQLGLLVWIAVWRHPAAAR